MRNTRLDCVETYWWIIPAQRATNYNRTLQLQSSRIVKIISLSSVNAVYEQAFVMDTKYPELITEKLCVSGVGHVKEANVILLMNIFFGLRHISQNAN